MRDHTTCSSRPSSPMAITATTASKATSTDWITSFPSRINLAGSDKSAGSNALSSKATDQLDDSQTRASSPSSPRLAPPAVISDSPTSATHSQPRTQPHPIPSFPLFDRQLHYHQHPQGSPPRFAYSHPFPHTYASSFSFSPPLTAQTALSTSPTNGSFMPSATGTSPSFSQLALLAGLDLDGPLPPLSLSPEPPSSADDVLSPLGRRKELAPHRSLSPNSISLQRERLNSFCESLPPLLRRPSSSHSGSYSPSTTGGSSFVPTPTGSFSIQRPSWVPSTTTGPILQHPIPSRQPIGSSLFSHGADVSSTSHIDPVLLPVLSHSLPSTTMHYGDASSSAYAYRPRQASPTSGSPRFAANDNTGLPLAMSSFPSGKRRSSLSVAIGNGGSKAQAINGNGNSAGTGAGVKTKTGSRHMCLEEGCKSSFTRKSDLHRHAKSHLPMEFAKPFVCANLASCGRRFARKSALDKHMGSGGECSVAEGTTD